MIPDGGGSGWVTASTFGTGGAGPHQLVSQTVSGQSAVSFTWDAAGNRTGRTQGTSSSTLSWDAEGELSGTTGGSGSVSNVYDADGSRLVRSDGGTVTVYLPGGMEVSSSSDTAVSATRWYSFAGNLVAHRTGNGLSGVSSVVTDPQGSVVGTVHNTDWASGVVRKRPDPFGGARSATSVTSAGRGFLGAVHDSNALVLLGARYFDPAAGVFVSVDPLLDPGNPAQFNAYVYAGNNPVTWSDPSGLAWTGPVADGGDHRYVAKDKNATGKPKTKPTAGSLTQSSTKAGVARAGRGTYCGYSSCGAPPRGVGGAPMTAEQWAGVAAIALGVGLVVGGLACVAATAGICGVGIAVSWGGGLALAGGGAVTSGAIVVSGTAIGGTAVAVGGAATAGGIGVMFNKSSAPTGGGSTSSSGGSSRSVDEVLGALPRGRSDGVRTVRSDAELEDLYGMLSRGGEPVHVPGYKGTWIERGDGIRIGLRDASKSGGRTIDIRYLDGTIRKVHID